METVALNVSIERLVHVTMSCGFVSILGILNKSFLLAIVEKNINIVIKLIKLMFFCNGLFKMHNKIRCFSRQFIN